MLDKALKGSLRYKLLLAALAAAAVPGIFFYLRQLAVGLVLTGMSRDVSWGLYISQFTFFVGVAASAVMVVIPYYLHDYKQFSRVLILGEFLAVGAVSMCLMFIIADMGQPSRVFNMFLHPSPTSLMFWDAVSLSGYLALNLLIGWTSLSAEQKRLPSPKWLKPFIYLSIPWAVSIHTVTAFLYAGIPGRAIWLTAIMAARFLASAFASGPSLLIILALAVKKFGRYDTGRDSIQALAKIAAYALATNIFFLALEFFTAYYSGIPSHRVSLDYLFFGLEGHGALVPWMWTSMAMSAAAFIILAAPKLRVKETVLACAALMAFLGVGIEKGLGVVIGGFIPNAFESVTEYLPTAAEALITLSVWAMGAIVVTVLYKVVVGVRSADAVDDAINQRYQTITVDAG